MPSAATLLVFVVATSDRDPMPDALERAARQTLGAEATIVVRRVAELPPEARAAEMGEGAHVSSVAEVAWTDAEHRHARLHVRAREGAAWLDRDIGFAESDAPAEQGRTIGFALASMLPEAEAARAPQPPQPEPPPPVLTPPAPPPQPETPAAPPAPPSRWRGGIEAVGLLAQAFGGYGGGIGGGGAGELYVARTLALRFEGNLRSAEVTPAHGNAFIGTLGPGLAWRAAVPAVSTRFTLGARVDALLVYQAVTHFSASNGAPDTRGRWLPGANALFEGTWLFADAGSIVVAVGAEAAFGNTDVYIHDVAVTKLPPLRGLLETGIRVRF